MKNVTQRIAAYLLLITFLFGCFALVTVGIKLLIAAVFGVMISTWTSSIIILVIALAVSIVMDEADDEEAKDFDNGPL